MNRLTKKLIYAKCKETLHILEWTNWNHFDFNFRVHQNILRHTFGPLSEAMFTVSSAITGSPLSTAWSSSWPSDCVTSTPGVGTMVSNGVNGVQSENLSAENYSNKTRLARKHSDREHLVGTPYDRKTVRLDTINVESHPVGKY